MESENEQWLLKQIQKGNKEAFSELVKPLIGRAYHTSAAILGSRQLAEEAVQNALIETYTSLRRGKEIRHFRGWFSRVIANRALDIVRQENRHNNGVEIDGLDIRDTSASPLDQLMQKEQTSELLSAVMSLELQQRIVVILYYFQEMKIEEIASVLNVKEGTVKSRLHHARLKLNQLISFPQMSAKVVQL